LLTHTWIGRRDVFPVVDAHEKYTCVICVQPMNIAIENEASVRSKETCIILAACVPT